MSAKKALYQALRWTADSPANGNLERFGSHGAPWTLRTDLLSATPIVISAGLSDDIEFEDCFLKRYGGRLVALDPTPLCKAITQQLIAAHGENVVTYVADALDGCEGEQAYLAEIDPQSGEALYFYDEGSQPPRRDAEGPSPVFEKTTVRTRTVEGLMQEYNLPELDLLKLDIEGGEYAVLDSVIENQLPIRQIAVEFHHRFKGIGWGKTGRMISRLRENGYRLEWVSDWGEEFLFVKTGQ